MCSNVIVFWVVGGGVSDWLIGFLFYYIYVLYSYVIVLGGCYRIGNLF